MKAKCVKSFNGVPDGQIHGRLFEPGDIVSGSLAEVAIAEGWGVLIPAGDSPPASRPPAGGASAPDGRLREAESSGAKKKRAKAIKTHTMADGVKVSKGAILEGDEAEQAIADGWAIELAAKGPAPETK